MFALRECERKSGRAAVDGGEPDSARARGGRPLCRPPPRWAEDFARSHQREHPIRVPWRGAAEPRGRTLKRARCCAMVTFRFLAFGEDHGTPARVTVLVMSGQIAFAQQVELLL